MFAIARYYVRQTRRYSVNQETASLMQAHNNSQMNSTLSGFWSRVASEPRLSVQVQTMDLVEALERPQPQGPYHLGHQHRPGANGTAAGPCAGRNHGRDSGVERSARDNPKFIVHSANDAKANGEPAKESHNED